MRWGKVSHIPRTLLSPIDPYFERIVKEAGDAAKMFDKLKQMGASGVDVEGEQKAIEAEIAASRYKNNGSPGCEAQGTEQQGESLMFNSGSFEVVHEEIDPLHHTERALLPDKADVDRKTKEAAARERYRNRKLKK